MLQTQKERHGNTPALETTRLLLRRFTAKDASDLFLILNDREANRFLPWFPAETLEEAQEHLLKNYLSYYEKSFACRYAVCQKTDNRPIGYVTLGEDESHDFGYGLRSEFWHRGFMAEAAGAVVQWLKGAGLPYITATHDVQNPRSGKVMKRLGMSYRYSYAESWQPKNVTVTFRMYQLDFSGDAKTYRGYWERHPEHFVESELDD